MTNNEAISMIRNDMKLHHDYLSGEYRKALGMAVKALEAEQWIPCIALPETDGHYLVSNSRNTFEAVFVDGEWYSMSLNLLLDGVLAWRDLPTPYEGGQDE